MAYWHVDRATRFGASTRTRDHRDREELSEQARQVLQASQCTAREPREVHREPEETKERKGRRSSRAPEAPNAEVRPTPRPSSVSDYEIASELRLLKLRIDELQKREAAAESRRVCRVM